MKISKLAIKSVFVAAVLALTACASMGDGTVAEKRQAILDMQDNALARLYSEKPDTRSQVKDAAGYAVPMLTSTYSLWRLAQVMVL